MTERSDVRRWLWRLSLALGAGVTILIFWLWFSLLSPWGYTPPTGLAPVEPGSTHQVFVYGTLRSTFVRRLVIGRSPPVRSATLPGFRRQGLDLLPDAEAQTAGEAFVVEADELRRLDRYERLGIRYRRTLLTLKSGDEAWVYTRIIDNEQQEDG